MSHYSAHYHDGQEIHVGDVFSYGSEECLVTVVLDRNEALPQWVSWVAGLRETNSSGFLCQSWRSGPIFCDESDEDEVLVRRGVHVPDPEVSLEDGPFRAELYEAGATVDPDSLAQEPAALNGLRLVRTVSLAANSTALSDIIALLPAKAGLWRYTNYCIIPKIVVATAKMRIGFQKGWVIANVFDFPRQFAAPLTDEEYERISKTLADCL